MKNIINKTILFAAFFAAGLSNISANAQYVSQAEARVYSDIGTLNYEVADINTGTANYDILGNTPVDDIVNSIVAAFMTSGRNQNIAETNTRSFFRELPGDIGANDLQNGLPVFTGIGVLDAGDRIVFRDEGGTNRQTVRIYTDGTDLFMASGEGILRPAPVVAPRTSDMLQVGEFWIDSNTNRQATELSSDLYGFVDAVCDTDNGYELQADRITCEAPPLNCDGGSTTGVDGDGDGNCDCLGDAQIQVDAENCRSPETLQDCVNAGFTSFNPETVLCTNTAPNCTDNATLNDAGVCECDPGFPILEEEGENTFACRAPLVATDCGDDLPDFYDGSTCVSDCGEGFRNPANAGETCIEITAADCGQNNMPDFYDGSMCVADCGDDFVNPANAGETCRPIAEVLATVSVSPTYTAESCERAGWISSITINSEKTEVAEVCGIPVERNDNLPAAAARESQPQIADGEMATGCIIRESSNFLTLPDCGDPELFGNDGFPQMPENFNIANDRLIVVVVADGRNRIFFNDNEIRIAVASPRNNDAEVAIIGAVGVAMAMYAFADFLHDGRPADAFAFSSDFGYRISENDYFVQAGGKIEYAVNENLRMQWSAGQTNTGGDFGDFRYLSKAEYKADFWTAAFSESVAGKTADYDFSLSADLQNGIWKISPVYRMQSEWKESDSGIKTETQNELNLESEFRYNNWQIRPSAGFKWENFGNFTENGKLQMNAVYRF